MMIHDPYKQVGPVNPMARKIRVYEAVADAVLASSVWTVSVKRLNYDGTLDGAAFSVGCVPPKTGTDAPVLTGDRVIIVLTWDGIRVAVPASGIGDKMHNDLDGLQGGDPIADEFYHLSADQLQQLIDEGVIDPVPGDCDQNVHPGDEEFDIIPGTDPDLHPGNEEGGSISDDLPGYDSHPGAADCYTTVPN
jgi:hypothetical protein